MPAIEPRTRLKIRLVSLGFLEELERDGDAVILLGGELQQQTPRSRRRCGLTVFQSARSRQRKVIWLMLEPLCRELPLLLVHEDLAEPRAIGREGDVHVLVGGPAAARLLPVPAEGALWAVTRHQVIVVLAQAHRLAERVAEREELLGNPPRR